MENTRATIETDYRGRDDLAGRKMTPDEWQTLAAGGKIIFTRSNGTRVSAGVRISIDTGKFVTVGAEELAPIPADPPPPRRSALPLRPRRTVYLPSVRLSETEAEQARLFLSGRRWSDVARSILCDAPAPGPSSRGAPGIDKAVTYQLARLGNNLNQVVALCHQAKISDAQILTEVQAIRVALDALTTAHEGRAAA